MSTINEETQEALRRPSLNSASSSETILSITSSVDEAELVLVKDVSVSSLHYNVGTLHQSTMTPVFFNRFRSSTALIVFTVAYSIFADIFIYDIILPVLPFSLHTRSGVPDSQIQIYVSAMLAVFAIPGVVSAPFIGFFADRLPSRRLPIFVGIAMLATGTAMMAFSKSIPVMLIGRALQGFSTGVTWTAPLALLAEVSPKDKIAQYMGYVAIGNCAAAVVSAAAGGAVFEQCGYYTVWAINFAVIGVEVVLWLLVIEPRRSTVCAPVLQNLNEQGMATGRKTTVVVEVSSMDNISSESIDQYRPATFRNLLLTSRLPVALFFTLLTASLLTSFDSTLVTHVSNTFSWTPFYAGLSLVPLMAPGFLSTLIGSAADRFGVRWSATIGYLTLAAAFLTIGLGAADNSSAAKAVLCVGLAVAGLAINLTWCPLMGEIMHAVDAAGGGPAGKGSANAYAQGYGLFTMMYAGGCTLGPIVAGALVERLGWRVMCCTLAGLAGAAVVPAFLFLGGWYGARRSTSSLVTTVEGTVVTDDVSVHHEDIEKVVCVEVKVCEEV